MVQNIIKKILILTMLLLAFGCNTSQMPPEVKLAEEQEHNLWRSGAQVYAPAGYNRYRISFRKAKEDLIKEKSRFVWLQDYRLVQSEFRDVLKTGYVLQEKILEQKNIKKENTSNQISLLKNRIETLKGLTEIINEGRLARKDLIKAELLLSEAISRYDNNDYVAAEDKIKNLSGFIKAAEDAILPIFNRYEDRSHINKWQQMADETIAESKNRGIPVIIVNKSKRILVLYKHGVPFKTYNVGLGRNGSLDKLRAGDNSTPEGRYRIIKKISKSRYRKALLINYPDEEDRRNFIRAKKKGLIPARARIGGLIEIHGGGKDSMTYGCIAMDNNAIDYIFSLVPVGTKVTIVGAVDYENGLSSAIEGL
ncbi:MAG: L,D-transpeptidase [Syntrophales bacterium]|nr:L,D-transpeptidase [Syntrophales bacterium]